MHKYTEKKRGKKKTHAKTKYTLKAAPEWWSTGCGAGENSARLTARPKSQLKFQNKRTQRQRQRLMLRLLLPLQPRLWKRLSLMLYPGRHDRHYYYLYCGCWLMCRGRCGTLQAVATTAPKQMPARARESRCGGLGHKEVSTFYLYLCIKCPIRADIPSREEPVEASVLKWK
jgi:hypothetical protein